MEERIGDLRRDGRVIRNHEGAYEGCRILSTWTADFGNSMVAISYFDDSGNVNCLFWPSWGNNKVGRLFFFLQAIIRKRCGLVFDCCIHKRVEVVSFLTLITYRAGAKTRGTMLDSHGPLKIGWLLSRSFNAYHRAAWALYEDGLVAAMKLQREWTWLFFLYCVATP